MNSGLTCVSLPAEDMNNRLLIARQEATEGKMHMMRVQCSLSPYRKMLWAEVQWIPGLPLIRCKLKAIAPMP